MHVIRGSLRARRRAGIGRRFRQKISQAIGFSIFSPAHIREQCAQERLVKAVFPTLACPFLKQERQLARRNR